MLQYLDQSLSHSLSLSPKQIQSLNILAMTNMEIDKYLTQEYIENPLLEITENKESFSLPEYVPSYYNNMTSWEDHMDYIQNLKVPETDELKLHLMYQLPLSELSPQQLDICNTLIDYLDEHGFFLYDTKETATITGFSEDDIIYCLSLLKTLSPIGIFSRSITENLIYQLKYRNELTPELERFIRNHLQDAAMGKISSVSRALRISTADIRKYLLKIGELCPYPLQNCGNETSSYIMPDIIVTYESHSWTITINSPGTNNYSINEYYLQMMQNTEDKELKNYYLEKYNRCNFIFQAIEQRAHTLNLITEQILRYQETYFLNGDSKQPMTMNEIAAAVGIHPSTISRAIKEKYIQTPRGTFLIRSLFTSGINNKSISKDLIYSKLKTLIKKESPKHPYSDARLTMLLNQDGIPITRRTVAKYRVALGIPGSVCRRR
ncbi:MAG: RNA polymerase factor sigma-54 [Muricomes sp.]|uniref:RNA polymerase factor sigma-54 n=1 Tax=Faecalicatena contorta TaxID=39482 RepID=UPI002EB43AB3|nr:RNA polymerase factor sigma-54 [Muricomes sp.]